jgi:hypothetical protein
MNSSTLSGDEALGALAINEFESALPFKVARLFKKPMEEIFRDAEQ